MTAFPEAQNIEARIKAESFVPLGWLTENMGEDIPGKALLLVGNAGPEMFERFAAERNPATDTMDAWTRDVLTPLAQELDAQAVFPFDVPHPPFLRWAQAAHAGHTSALGMNIRADYGLWHAFRAAFVFDIHFAIAPAHQPPSPCDACAERPCLNTCPVSAFSAAGYDVAACASHLSAPSGAGCRDLTCLARLACPVAPEFRYSDAQSRFHMVAFMRARGVEPVNS